MQLLNIFRTGDKTVIGGREATVNRKVAVGKRAAG